MAAYHSPYEQPTRCIGAHPDHFKMSTSTNKPTAGKPPVVLPGGTGNNIIINSNQVDSCNSLPEAATEN
jgi:hypothetical protein